MTRSPSWLTMRPSKGVAFTVHLILSLLIFSTLVAMMITFWFPGDLFFLDGGWQGLKLVAMVDLVLGPALTLLLFKPGKPGLVLDMSLIAIVQIAALGYGFYTTHQQRAVAIVFAERGFNTVSAKDIQQANEQLRALDVQPQPLPAVSAFKLPLLLTPAPEGDDYGRFLEDILNGYPGPQQRSDQYVSLADNQEAIKPDSLTQQDLVKEGMLDKVQNSLDKRSLQHEDVEFYRFKARYADGIAIYDPQANRIVDMLAEVDVETPSQPSNDELAVSENDDS